MDDGAGHSAFVNAWFARLRPLDAEQQITMFERALGALWTRARVTLGEITMTAIVDRVVASSHQRFGQMPLILLADGVLTIDAAAPLGGRSDVRTEWMQFVLTEYLTVVGGVTGEILTPGLHAALDAVGSAASPRDAISSSTEPRDDNAPENKGTQR